MCCSQLQAGAVRGRATSADDADAAAAALIPAAGAVFSPFRFGFVVANSGKQVKLFFLYSLSFQFAFLCLVV